MTDKQTDRPPKKVRIKSDRDSSQKSDDNTCHNPLKKVRIKRDRHSTQEMKIKRDKQTGRHSAQGSEEKT